jgi:serine/threonine protein kinase
MKYLGARDIPIVHCDLAARNVIVRAPMHIEVTDFGLARVLDADPLQDTNVTMPLEWTAVELLDPRVVAPEFTVENDIWAFGITTWEIFTFCKQELYPELGLREYYSGGKTKKRLVMRKRLYKHLRTDGNLLPKPEGSNFDLYLLMLGCEFFLHKVF